MAGEPNAQELAQRRAVQADILKACSIAPRSSWSPQPAKPDLEYDWNYDSLVVHYSGHQAYTMQSIQQLDMEHHQWSDFAYHYAVTREGKLIEGREILYKGSDVLKQNTGKIGIVCIGDFDASVINWRYGNSYSGEAVPNALVLSLRKLSQYLQSTFPIKYFGGHKEYGITDVCPGSNLMPTVEKMRGELKLQKPTFRKV